MRGGWIRTLVAAAVAAALGGAAVIAGGVVGASPAQAGTSGSTAAASTAAARPAPTPATAHRRTVLARPRDTLPQPRVVAIATLPGGGGYWIADARGAVAGFADAPFVGSGAGMSLGAPVVAMAADPNGHGYWLVGADGGVLTFGEAQFFGSAAGGHLTSPVVGMAVTPDGGGYWLVEADWTVLSFGDALPLDPVPGMRPTAPAVGMAATSDGQGFWVAGADGTVLGAGDAIDYGAVSAPALGAPVVGVAATPDGRGYWLAGANGAVAAYGDATYFGSAALDHADIPIVGVAATPDGGGYWLVGQDGGVFGSGDASYLGGAPVPPSQSRIGLFGDSLSSQARRYFTYVAGGTALQVVGSTFGGTAVCDALSAIEADAELLHLSAAVLQFSGDDATPCMAGYAAGSPAFFAKYRSDMEKAISILTAAGVRVFLAGAPPTSTAAGSVNLDDLNQMYAGLAATHPGVSYVDAGAAVTVDGAFTWRMACLPIEECDGSDGTNTVRSPDGVHFCPWEVQGLASCPGYSSGAFRYAVAMLSPVARYLGR
jgi:hypothetical protein